MKLPSDWPAASKGCPAQIPLDGFPALADLLAELREQRLGDLSQVRRQMQLRDLAGRNLDVSDFQCGALDEVACHDEFRATGDRVRDFYDIT